MTKRKSQAPYSPTKKIYSNVKVVKSKDTRIYEAHSWKGGRIRIKIKGKPHKVLSSIRNILYSKG